MLITDACNCSRNGEALKSKELKEIEFADIDCTYDDQIYSAVDDVLPNNLKTYQPFTPTTLNSPSLYMVPAKKRPDVL